MHRASQLLLSLSYLWSLSSWPKLWKFHLNDCRLRLKIKQQSFAVWFVTVICDRPCLEREPLILKFPVIPASKLSLDLETGNRTNFASVFWVAVKECLSAALLEDARIGNLNWRGFICCIFYLYVLLFTQLNLLLPWKRLLETLTWFTQFSIWRRRQMQYSQLQ